MKWVAVLVAGALAGAAACGETTSSEQLGEELFESLELSPSSLNQFTCRTCHDTDLGAPPGKSGYNLHGVAARTAYWGGDRATLRDAVDACLVFFMKGTPIKDDDDNAHALYDYLLSITPDGSSEVPLPFTIVENVADVPRGDPDRGSEVYRASCEICHGAAFTAEGSILRVQVNLPGITESYPEDFPGVDPSLVVIEKVRHGRFFDIGGDMAPYSLEALSDEDLGALLAFLEL